MNNVVQFTAPARPSVPAMAGSLTTMTSREIAGLTGKRHDNVCRDMRTMFFELELDALNFEDNYLDANNRAQTGYALNEELSITLVSGYDTKMRLSIIKRWKELEVGVSPAKPLTQAEMFMQSAQALMAFQGRCEAIESTALALSTQIDKQHDTMSARMDSVEDSAVWKVCPSTAESIMHIRQRINVKHGLSGAIVDEVLRQSVYAPKPAGMVLNASESARGSHYAVYWKKDVTKVFEVFMKETRKETAARFSHPIIAGKFKAHSV